VSFSSFFFLCFVSIGLFENEDYCLVLYVPIEYKFLDALSLFSYVYLDISCIILVTPCTGQPCNPGKCTVTGATFTCSQCFDGYTGQQCEGKIFYR
jgi:hypothetical protein